MNIAPDPTEGKTFLAVCHECGSHITNPREVVPLGSDAGLVRVAIGVLEHAIATLPRPLRFCCTRCLETWLSKAFANAVLQDDAAHVYASAIHSPEEEEPCLTM